MRARVFAVTVVIAGMAGITLAAGGCEAIVGDSPSGTVSCFLAPGADGSGLCPEGQSCIAGACKVSTTCFGPSCGPHDGGFDAPPPRDTGTDRDGTIMQHDVVADVNGHDADAGDTSSPIPLGGPCLTTPACEPGLICGTASTLLTGVDAGAVAVCTKPCCTSADCDDPKVPGFVCYPSVGGDYCVDPRWIGLSADVGSGLPGSKCTLGTDCRSSVCSGGHCQDTCCLDAECMSSTACQESVLDGVSSFNCALPMGTTSQGGDCSEGSDCKSNECYFPLPVYYGFCFGACCNDTGCMMPGSWSTTSCNWVEVGTDGGGAAWLRTCSPPYYTAGAAYGAACSVASDCASSLCYQKSKCTAPCCVDADCSGGWVCGYASFGPPFPDDLQVCVPPSP